jgi:hypothetical protein
MRILIAALLVAFSVTAFPSFADQAGDRRMELAREIVVLSGAAEVGRRALPQLRQQFIRQLRQSYSEEASTRIWDLFVEEFEAGLPQLVDEVAAEYARALTEEELRGVRDFYLTAPGRALVAVQSEVMVAAQRAGAAIGARSGTRAEQRYLAERRAGPT